MSEERRNGLEECWGERPTFDPVEPEGDCICTNLADIAEAIREGGGGGGVTRVNGKTGNVTLTGEDIDVSTSDTTTIDVALGNKEDKLTFGTDGQVMTTNSAGDGYEWKDVEIEVTEEAILNALGYEKHNVTIGGLDYEIIGKLDEEGLYYGYSTTSNGKTLYIAGTPTANATIQNNEALASTGEASCGWNEQRETITSVVIENVVSPTSTNSWFYNLSICTSFTGLENIDTSGTTNMTFMFNNCGQLATLDVSGFNTSNVEDMSYMFAGCSSLVALDLSTFDVSRVMDMTSLFNGCSMATTINVSTWNTQSAKVMIDMFANCSTITELDLSLFNTSSVGDMSEMFYNDISIKKIYASNLFDTSSVSGSSSMFLHDNDIVGGNGTTYDSTKTDKEYARIDTASTPGYFSEKAIEPHLYWGLDAGTLYLSNVETPNAKTQNDEALASTQSSDCGWDSARGSVTSVVIQNEIKPQAMSYWFFRMYSCNSITGLEKIDTSGADDYTRTFGDCYELVTLDISTWDTARATGMMSMFDGSYKLETIYTSDLFDTSNVTESSGMFSGCNAIVGGNGTTYDSSKTDKEYARIDTAGAPGYFSEKPIEKHLYWGNEGSTLYLSNVETPNAKTQNDEALASTQSSDCGWDSIRESIESVEIENEIYPTSTAYWFSYLTNCTSFTGIENINTSETTNMARMFYNCEQLTALDVSGFDTSNVTTIEQMFTGCSNLNTLTLTGWQTSKVSNMNSTFANCIALTSLDVSSFDTSMATNLKRMFFGCKALTTIDVSSFNTTNVTDMAQIFADCERIETITLGDTFITSSVTNMQQMFSGCHALTSIDVSGFDTSSVTNMAGMFNNCRALTDINVSNFDTTRVTNMGAMFMSCPQITTLNVTNFDTSSVEIMDDMFCDCAALTTIYASNTFITTSVLSSEEMFYNSTSLVGGNGTTYDATHIDSEYARIDTTDAPGYFSREETHLYYGIVEDGSNKTLYISGIPTTEATTQNDEALASADSSDCGWNEQRETITSVVIQNSVKPTSTAYWFMSLYICESIVGSDKINTSETTDMGCMFISCEELTSLDLSTWDTSSVEIMAEMFHGCEELTSLDVSTWDTSSVTNMNSMFRSCEELTTIYASESFDTTNVTDDYRMFIYCEAIIGGNGTTYDVDKVDKEYARIDTSTTPGYFTAK